MTTTQHSLTPTHRSHNRAHVIDAISRLGDTVQRYEAGETSAAQVATASTIAVVRTRAHFGAPGDPTFLAVIARTVRGVVLSDVALSSLLGDEGPTGPTVRVDVYSDPMDLDITTATALERDRRLDAAESTPDRCSTCGLGTLRDRLVDGMCPRCRYLSAPVDRLDGVELYDAVRAAYEAVDQARADALFEEMARRAEHAADESEAGDCDVCRRLVVLGDGDEFCSAACYVEWHASREPLVAEIDLHESDAEDWLAVPARAG